MPPVKPTNGTRAADFLGLFVGRRGVAVGAGLGGRLLGQVPGGLVDRDVLDDLGDLGLRDLGGRVGLGLLLGEGSSAAAGSSSAGASASAGAAASAAAASASLSVGVLGRGLGVRLGGAASTRRRRRRPRSGPSSGTVVEVDRRSKASPAAARSSRGQRSAPRPA